MCKLKIAAVGLLALTPLSALFGGNKIDKGLVLQGGTINGCTV